MEKSNIERLQHIADGLDDLNDKVTYVGGSVTQLYATDSAATEPRPTMDVDCVVEYFSFKEKMEFEEMLRKKHFEEDKEDGTVICRWLYKGEEVDIMPTDEKYLGFTNRWYKPGIKNRVSFTLPNGRIVYIMSALYFVASKLEAITSRGGIDLRGSKDFEDVIYILNYCPDFTERYNKEENKELKSFVTEAFMSFYKRPNIMEEIECAMPYGEEDRSDIILDIFKSICK